MESRIATRGVSIPPNAIAALVHQAYGPEGDADPPVAPGTSSGGVVLELPVQKLAQLVDEAVRDEDICGAATSRNLAADADAGFGLAGGSVDVAHVQADDLGQAQAGAEGETEGEVVAGVGGGDCQEGGLLGLGQGLGAQRGLETTEPWGRTVIKEKFIAPYCSRPSAGSTTEVYLPRDMLVRISNWKPEAVFWIADEVLGKGMIVK